MEMQVGFYYEIQVNGSLERYKSRLVAKSYTQTYGVDNQKTFAPVAKTNTVRVLLFLAANYNWNLQRFNVKNVFLHDDLEEEIYIYIQNPLKFGGNLETNKVRKLRKVLYDLKKSLRAWLVDLQR